MIRVIVMLWAMMVLFSLGAHAQAPAATDQKPPFEDDGTTRADLVGALPTDIVIGSKDAPITIIEYASGILVSTGRVMRLPL